MLADLAVRQHPQQGDITLLALNHLSTESVKKSPRLKRALQSSLEEVKGSKEYLELIKRYELKEYNTDLLTLALEKPGETIGGEAAQLLLALGGEKAMKDVAKNGDQDQKEALIQALKQVNNASSFDVLQAIILDADQPLSIQKEAVRAFTGSWAGEDRLLHMVQNGDLNASLDSTAIQVFAMAGRSSIYAEAARLLGIEAPDGTDESMAPVEELVAMRGDAENGHTVFSKFCQNCHVVGEQGVDYGPGLSEIGDKLPKEGLYTAILEPSQGISFGYEGYTIKLKDGSQVTGYMLSKNEDEVQMRLYGGLTNTYQRSEIDTIEEMDQSLMFDNLERGMSQQDLVDLVEYLTTLKKEGTQISLKK